jgi:hypothetical protein
MTDRESIVLDDVELRQIDAYWRADLSVGQIYLLSNPLLRERCAPSTSSRACSATGARRPAGIPRSSSPAPGHGGPGSSPTRASTGPIRALPPLSISAITAPAGYAPRASALSCSGTSSLEPEP